MKNENGFSGRFQDIGGSEIFCIVLFLSIFFGGFTFFIELGKFVPDFVVYIFFLIYYCFVFVGFCLTLGIIFGHAEKESVGTKVTQKIKNPVYDYTQPATRTRPPHTDQASDRKLSPATPTPVENILPPESFFSVPRKIDWDILNKTRKHHGDLGEMFVCDLEKNYLTKVGRSDLAERVHHVASEGDGHGYDIQSFNKDGSKKFIEVKATNSSTGSILNISKNEFSFLKNNLSSAVVYHVHNVNNERETTVVVYPAGEVLNSPNISPSGYVVKM